MKVYLYYYSRYGKDLFRAAIVRETKSNVWIKSGLIETKISKKTYRTGSNAWNITSYHHETPELLQKYLIQRRKRDFLSKLSKLQKCEDIKIMEKIIAI